MSRGTVGELNVELKADQRGLRGDLSRAEQQVKHSAQKMQENIDKNIRFGAAFAKGLAAAGALEAGIKGLNILTAAMNGDLDRMNELWAQMPFGIGPVASAIQGLTNDIIGATEATKRFDEQLKRGNETKAVQQQADQLIQQLDRKFSLVNIRNPLVRQLRQLEIERDAALNQTGGRLRKGQAEDIRVRANLIFNAQANPILKELQQQRRDDERRRKEAFNANQALVDATELLQAPSLFGFSGLQRTNFPVPQVAAVEEQIRRAQGEFRQVTSRTALGGGGGSNEKPPTQRGQERTNQLLGQINQNITRGTAPRVAAGN